MLELEPLTILLVEDDPADQKLIKTSQKSQKIANELHIVNSGEEGIDFLCCRGDYSSGTPRPDLILLDLNMPGMGGKQFLKWIKDDEGLKYIPVVILTTSASDRDFIDSYELQASGYVNRPVTLEQFVQVVEGIKEHWFVMYKRPAREY